MWPFILICQETLITLDSAHLVGCHEDIYNLVSNPIIQKHFTSLGVVVLFASLNTTESTAISLSTQYLKAWFDILYWKLQYMWILVYFVIILLYIFFLVFSLIKSLTPKSSSAVNLESQQTKTLHKIAVIMLQLSNKMANLDAKQEQPPLSHSAFSIALFCLSVILWKLLKCRGK